MACVNTNLPGFKKLAAQLGKNLTESIVIANDYKIPTLEEAISIIRGTNVQKYKKAVKYLQTTKSSDVDELVKNLNRILQKYNGDYYVVKGARLQDKPAPMAAIEIQDKHVAFLNALNGEFGNIFTVGTPDGVPAATASQNNTQLVRDAIANDPRVFNNLTEDGNGNYVFFHYSNSDLSKKGIDPTKFGKNTNLTGREEAGRSVPVSLFYTDNNSSEPGLGNFKHVVRIPENEVYPFNSDPLGLYNEAEKRFKEAYPDKAFNPNEQIGWIGKVAGEHGFKMTVGYWDNGKQKTLRAESISKAKPELIQSPLTGGFYGPNAIKNLTDEKFLNNKVRYKNKAKEYFQKAIDIPVAKNSKLFNEPNPETKIIADKYKVDNNILTDDGSPITKLDVNNSKAIADAYASMKHNPNDPQVKASYQALAIETLAQYDAIQAAGYRMELYDGVGEPYSDSAAMIADVRDNKHSYVLSTENDFGQNTIDKKAREENPLLNDSGRTDIKGKPLLLNDIFRFVHDFFGHTERGNSFGPVGEENAWDVHARMYTDLARRAMTTETRGQNSWVNFGSHMRKQIFDSSKVTSKSTKDALTGTNYSISYDGKQIGNIHKDSTTGYWYDSSVEDGTVGKAEKGLLSTENKNDAIRTLVLNNVKNVYTSGEQNDLLKKDEEGYLSATERPFAEQKIGLLDEKYSNILPTVEATTEKQPAPIISPNSIKVGINQTSLNELAQRNREEALETKNVLQQRVNESAIEENPNSYEAYIESGKLKSGFVLQTTTDLLQRKFNIPFTFESNPNAGYRALYRNGTIVINQALVRPDTPFHEIVHPFLLTMKQENPEVYQSLVNDLNNDEQGKRILESTQRNYSELSPAEQVDEAIAEYVGQLAGQRNLESKPWYQQFIDWMKGLLSKLGVYTPDFKMDMSISQFADLIVDPNYSKDLANKQSHEERDTYYQKVGASNFDEMMDTIVQKLRADSQNFSKNSSQEEKTRKYISSKQADEISKNRRDLKAIDNFVFSSVLNLKNLNDRFEDFKKIYDSKTSKSEDDVKKLANILSEVENAVSLYEDVDLLLDAVMNEFTEDEIENSNISSLNKNYRKEAALIRSYGKYAKEVISEWLVQTPNAKKAINQAIANNTVTQLVPAIAYDKVATEFNKNGITDKKTILREAFKRELGDYLITAKKDASALTQFLGPLIHSRDPLSSLIAIAVTDEYTKAVKTGVAVQHHLKDLVKRVRGNLKPFTNNEDHKAFYEKYLRKAISYEYKGLGKNLKPEYHEVQRDAFHEEFKWDEFAKAKRLFEEQLGPRPSKNATGYDAWKNKRDAWYKANSTTTTDAKGVVTTVPGTQYRNAEFQMLKNDELFKDMYKAYKEANDKLGNSRLKHGIIPQDKISNVSFDKANLGKDITEKIRLFAGEDDQVYFSQKNNLEEKRNVPAGYTKLVNQNELSYDLLNSVSKFAISAEKYKSISNIEPHVNILKNFIGGNSSLDISKRSVVRTNASGIKALSKVENKMMKVEAERLNKQLDAFLNDVVYGEAMKKQSVELMDAKFQIEDKDGNKKEIRGFENVVQEIGVHNLDYSGFEVGKTREIGTNKITMLRKDWNFSTKKVGNRLGLLTALSNMAINPTSGIVNVLRAKLETFVEGAGGRYFNLRDAGKGEAEYFKALGSGDFMEDLRGGKPSFLSSMIIDYDAIQGELIDEAGRKVPGSLANKLFRRNHLFFLQNGGEHYVQTHLMIAMMNHQKVKLNTGEEISLYEAKKREFEGKLNVAKDTNWTADDDAAFKNNLKFVNTTMHGNFNKLDKAYLQRTWWGSLVMMFRKHLYVGFASRYRSGYVNYQTGQYTEGYYRTFASALLNQVRGMVENKRMAKWSDLNEQEKYAFRKMGADLAVFALLIASFKLFDDDDDKDEVNDYAALISRRLISESVQYTPVVGTIDLARVVTNPTASASTVDKLYKALYQTISDPTEEYKHTGPGYTAGDNKALTMWGRAIPIYKQAVNTMEPERLLQFYQTNSIDFFKPSKLKNGQ